MTPFFWYNSTYLRYVPFIFLPVTSLKLGAEQSVKRNNYRSSEKTTLFKSKLAEVKIMVLRRLRRKCTIVLFYVKIRRLELGVFF